MILSGRQAALRKSLLRLSLSIGLLTAKLHFKNMRLVALCTGGYVIQDLAF